MLIPNRYIHKPKIEPKEITVEKVVQIKDNSDVILAEFKKALGVKKAPKYVFSILRDKDGLMTEVVATPADFDTIL